MKNNPCKGVRKFSLKARTVYITDEQYAAIYAEAIPQLRIAMEISYLCAARLGDVLELKWQDIMDKGTLSKTKPAPNKSRNGHRDYVQRSS